MRLPSGHPAWQKGTPQFMQRAAWRRSFSSENGALSSRKSRSRSGTERSSGSSLPYSMNPVGLPIVRPPQRSDGVAARIAIARR